MGSEMGIRARTRINREKNMKKIELLAPVGSFDSLKAAVQNPGS
ncbi:hypothetical protein JSCD17_36140 [Clostridioides difficile]|nr:hypothetical protein [Clostridioides difficile]GML20741.1 hypothetical protein JSCD17_36140 [Clostridioides difficile]